MDINRVHYFHVFAQTGSLTKAAEILRITQPALSKALRLLQEEMGLKLLRQDGRGLILTESGHHFKKVTAPLLQQWSDVSAQVKGLGQAIPTKVGSFEVFTTYFLPLLVKAAKLENIEVHELLPGILEKAIADGIVDVGITYIPIPHAGVEFVEVGKIQMGVFGLQHFLKQNDFSELPFIVPLQPLQGAPTKVVGLDGWPDHKFSRNIKFKVTMMESAMALCREGIGVAYLPKFVVELHNQKISEKWQLKELSNPIPKKDHQQSVFIEYRKSVDEGVFIRQIAKCLRNLS